MPSTQELEQSSIVGQYQSVHYDASKITGRTVRYERTRDLGVQYYVREYETDPVTGIPGEGEYMAEYRTAGEDIPEAIKIMAKETRRPVRW